MKKELINEAFKKFKEQQYFKIIAILTDIASGKGLNGVDYLAYYHGIRKPCNDEEYIYEIDDLTINDDVLMFKYKTSSINKSKFSSFYPEHEYVILPIEHVVEIQFTN